MKVDAISEAKKYLQVFADLYTAEFPCFTTLLKGDKYGFSTACTFDVSISHGGKTDKGAHCFTEASELRLCCGRTGLPRKFLFKRSAKSVQSAQNAYSQNFLWNTTCR